MKTQTCGSQRRFHRHNIHPLWSRKPVKAIKSCFWEKVRPTITEFFLILCNCFAVLSCCEVLPWWTPEFVGWCLLQVETESATQSMSQTCQQSETKWLFASRLNQFPNLDLHSPATTTSQVCRKAQKFELQKLAFVVLTVSRVDLSTTKSLQAVIPIGSPASLWRNKFSSICSVFLLIIPSWSVQLSMFRLWRVSKGAWAWSQKENPHKNVGEIFVQETHTACEQTNTV